METTSTEILKYIGCS